MSGPPPVVIQFLTKGLTEVQKALNDIQSVVTKTEKQSTAAANAGRSARQKVLDQEVRDKIAAYRRADRLANSARDASLKKSESIARAEARVAAREAEAAAKAKIAAYKQADKLLEQSYRETEKRLQGIRERSASMAGKYAKQQADAEIRIRRQLQVERNRALLDYRRGDKVSSEQAHLSPLSRRALLDSAKGKSLAEQKAILEKAQFMRQEAQLARQQQKQKESEEEAHQRRMRAMKERSATEMGNIAKREAAKEAAERLQARKQFASTVLSGAGRGVSTGTHIVGAASKAALNTALNMGGGVTVEDALRQQLDLDRQAALVVNDASLNGQRPIVDGKALNKEDVKSRIKAASVATGTDASELMAGLKTYGARSSDYAGGLHNLEFFGKVAKASGASVEDVMGTFGTMRVQNPNLTPDRIKALTLSTVMQARQGSIEFSDMAKAGGKVTRTATEFAGDQGDNQRRLLGLAQIGMRTGGGNVSEVATTLSNVSGDAMRHKDAVRAFLGKDFLNSDGQIMQKPEEFMADIMKATGGRIDTIIQSEKQGGLGFSLRTRKAYEAVKPVFDEAKHKVLADGGSENDANEAGRKAILAEADKVIGGKYDEKDLDRDFAAIMQTSAEQFDAAARELKNVVGEKLLPPLTNLIPIIRDLTVQLGRVLESFSSLANWATSHPLESALMVLGGSIVKEIMSQIVSAKIGEVIKSMLMGGPAPGVPGVPGAAGGVGGGAGAGAGALGLAGLGAGAQLFSMAQLGDERYGAVSAGQDEARSIREGLDSGDPLLAHMAQGKIADAKKKAGGGNTAMAYFDTATKAIETAINPLGYLGGKAGEALSDRLGGNSGSKQAVEALRANEIVNAPELKTEIAKAVVEGVKQGMATAPPKPPGVPSGPAPIRDSGR